MPRPKKHPYERRTAQLPPVRVTDAEWALASEAADAAGLSLSDYIRQRATTDGLTVRPGLKDAQLLSELNRCGVNLNQIARHLNYGDARVDRDIGLVLGELYRVLEIVGRAYGP